MLILLTNDDGIYAPGLAAMGHTVEEVPLVSGLGFIKRTSGGWIGAADPRRDGTAMGQ